MASHHFIVATAGHVDHGKSALVKALTGTDPDRLPEEKARGITIDLGFAHLALSTPTPAPTIFDVGIVDVPGHEDFVKNMVAGVGSIDAALLVVAADDGWMPQTEEHLQILAYLGVNRAVVALTKIDLVESEAERVQIGIQIKEQLRESPFATAPVIATSVVSQSGLDGLKTALATVLADTPPPRDFGKPRLPVDRVFTLRGIGTVVTGTLSGGVLRRGQNVVIQPGGRKSRVRSLQSHNREIEAAGPGMRTAINLPDVTGHSEQNLGGVARGDVVTLAELGSACDTLDVLLEKSARLRESQSVAARPLKDGALVRVHHGSGHFSARVRLLDGGMVEPGQHALAQLRSEAPVYAFAGDRFIIRDWAEQWTLGGGVILDPDAARKQFRSERNRRYLEVHASSPYDISTFILSLVERDGAVRRSALLHKSKFSTAQISEVAAQLAEDAKTIQAGEWLVNSARWQNARQTAMEAIESEHRLRPQLPGLALSELRQCVERLLPAPELFDALIADLFRSGFVQTGTAIRSGTHRPALPPNLQSAGVRVRASLSAKPFEPPSRKELAPDGAAQQALRFLLETGEAVEIGDEVVLLAESFARLTSIVKEHLRAHGSATVSELRQAVGASRRILVPALERLDREGITRRDGDKRVLR